MKKLLFIDACVRGEKSRTKELCDTYIHCYAAANPDTVVDRVPLTDLDIKPLSHERILERNGYVTAGDFSQPMFDLANQLKSADVIVIGTPYYDLSFASVLKVYIENVVVADLTFLATDTGFEGLCNSEKMVYITTAGGSMEGQNFGYDYFCGMSGMLGLGEPQLIKAEMLDVFGYDADAIMKETKEQIAAMF
ncbi:MAG: NAD(P)H-dependent oxidoreductase [Eubacteriaceae bacterium]|nr:NAD(P)H-dependent oxidoreductase [Eubacteriaceae bacterium]